MFFGDNVILSHTDNLSADMETVMDFLLNMVLRWMHRYES